MAEIPVSNGFVLEHRERPLMNMLIGSYGDKKRKIRAAGGCNVNDSEIKGRVSFIHDHRLRAEEEQPLQCCRGGGGAAGAGRLGSASCH
jgi:hypothetical protein